MTPHERNLYIGARTSGELVTLDLAGSLHDVAADTAALALASAGAINGGITGEAPWITS